MKEELVESLKEELQNEVERRKRRVIRLKISGLQQIYADNELVEYRPSFGLCNRHARMWNVECKLRAQG